MPGLTPLGGQGPSTALRLRLASNPMSSLVPLRSFHGTSPGLEDAAPAARHAGMMSGSEASGKGVAKQELGNEGDMPYTFDDWSERLYRRPDLPRFAVHLTRRRIVDGKQLSDVQVLVKILSEQKLIGSSTSSGFIIGRRDAVCFHATPIHSLVANHFFERDYQKQNPGQPMRYSLCGLMFDLPFLFGRGGRPVIYDKSDEAKAYLPEDQHWRIVDFDLGNSQGFTDWTHEREWRAPGDLEFSLQDVVVVVGHRDQYREFVRCCNELAKLNILESIRGLVSAVHVFA